jgi:hypothetical protein
MEKRTGDEVNERPKAANPALWFQTRMKGVRLPGAGGELCKQAMNVYGKVLAPGRQRAVLYGGGPGKECAIHMNCIALVYWPSRLESKDPGGKGDRAEYITSIVPQRAGRSIITVNELTMDSPPMFEVPYPTYARISGSCEWLYSVVSDIIRANEKGEYRRHDCHYRAVHLYAANGLPGISLYKPLLDASYSHG